MPRPKKIDSEDSLLQEEEKWTGKAKIHSKTLKDKSVILLDGVTVCFDKDGIAEVEEERVAKYLLSIPSYELVKSKTITSNAETIDNDVEKDILEENV